MRLHNALTQLISTLGHDGGLISPSVYDTAQLLRFQPPQEGVTPAITWLKAQQHADGGWGDPAVPPARDIPTLAAILALQQYGADHDVRPQIAHGLAFLRDNSEQWSRAHIDLLPIAAEMILPRLLADAAEAGIVVDPAPYATLYDLAAKKRDALACVHITAGSAPTYSWEALDHPFDPDLLDCQGSIGHSPAATAYWLQKAASTGASVAPAALATARRYLIQAAAATQTGIPGVVPTVWPLPVFEYTYALMAFVQNGLHVEKEFAPQLAPHVALVKSLLERNNGLGFSDIFVADVDSTSVGACAIAACGFPYDPAIIEQFRYGDHYLTFPGELNSSTFSNAHALTALAYADVRHQVTEQFLIDRELSCGGWRADKWHSSWIYTSLEVAIALKHTQHTDRLRRVVRRLIREQSHDGAWSRDGKISELETTYAVMLLRLARTAGQLQASELCALDRASSWLMHHADTIVSAGEQHWMGKELYAPVRVDLAYQLSTLWALHKEQELVDQYA